MEPTTIANIQEPPELQIDLRFLLDKGTTTVEPQHSENLPLVAVGTKTNESVAHDTTATHSNIPSPRILGIATLSFIFVAGATLSFSYFNEPVVRQRVAAEQAAAVVVAVDTSAFQNLAIQAQSAYVYDLKTQQPLFALNPDEERPLASLTKVAMALVVSEVLRPDANITIPQDTAPAGAFERLRRGDVWHEQDLMNFTLIASNNAGADILSAAANDGIHAKYPLSPATSSVVWRMNDLVQSLGVSTMHFVNDNGLDVSTSQSGGYGTARGVATLLGYAASTSLSVFAYTVRNDDVFTSVNGHTATAINTNTALGSIPGIVMGKTGYTDLAGGNLAVVFDVGPSHPVVAVVMGSTQEGRFEDMKRLVAATIASITASK